MDRGQRAALVLGSVDGVILVLGLVAGLVVARQSAGTVWHAALSGGLVELVGMAAAGRLSGQSRTQAWACGAATAAAAIVPATPFLAAAGAAAVACSLALVALEAAAVAWLRPEHGRTAVFQTFGWLALAGVVSALGGLT